MKCQQFQCNFSFLLLKYKTHALDGSKLQVSFAKLTDISKVNSTILSREVIRLGFDKKKTFPGHLFRNLK